ncbi:MAG TPA: MMPL family transporter [Aeromicrobium sp.]|nr:MMPL family transporter [Aeromicrobium sp.]
MAGDSASEWTEALSAFVVRHARAVIIVWIALVGGLNVAIPQIEEVIANDSTSFIPLDAPAVVGLERMDDQFGDGKSASFVQVIGQRDGGLTDADRRYFHDLGPRLKADEEHVSFVQDLEDHDVREALTSDDGEAMYLTVGIPGATGAPAANNQIDAVRGIAHTQKPAGLQVEVSGSPTTIRDMTHTIESSLATITIAILAAIAIIVQLLYRSVGVTLLILAVIGTALGVGRALVSFAGMHLFGISTFTASIMTTVVLAAACDYAVFLISRYHEFRREGLEPQLAAAMAGSRVSGVIIGSALTVAIANAAMLLADIAFFRTTGPAVAVSVLSTLVLAVTLIPAVLAVAGEHGMMEPRPVKADGGFWGRMAGLVVTHPTRVLMAGLVPLVTLAAFYPTLETSYDERGNQPDDTESNRGFELMADHFPVNEATPSFVVISSDQDLRSAKNLAAIERASDSVARIDGIKEVRSITRPKGETIDEASVGYQAGEVGEELDEAGDEIADGSEDMQDLVDGADELDEGAGKLDDGAERFADEMDKSVEGVQKLLDGSSELRRGLRALHHGAGDARAGSAALSSGADRLADSLEQGADQAQVAVDGLGMAYDALATKSLTCNVDPACRAARDGIKQIYEAERDQLVPGMRQAAAAARQIANGSASLDGGMAQLEAGLARARDGASRIHDGHDLMASEVDELEEGVEKLNDATDKLTEGTGKVADGTEEAGDSMEELEDGLDEASDYLLELGDNAGDPSIGGFYLPEDAFEDDDLVSAVDLFLSDDSTTARLFVLDKVDAQERPAAIRIAEVEKAVDGALAGTALAGADVYITGSAPFNVNLHDLSQADFRLVATVALLAVLIILIVMLRSLVAPLFLVGSVVLSYAASMGLGVLVWQDFLGHKLDWTVPSIAFVMLVAVGADYNLLLMKRIQEEAPDGSRAGIGRALTLTGGVITAAGIIFAASMFAMMTAQAVGLAQTGFVIGMGLLIDTFIVRTFIVPSVGILLGPAMWWPRRPDRIVPMDELLREREYATST